MLQHSMTALTAQYALTHTLSAEDGGADKPAKREKGIHHVLVLSVLNIISTAALIAAVVRKYLTNAHCAGD